MLNLSVEYGRHQHHYIWPLVRYVIKIAI